MALQLPRGNHSCNCSNIRKTQEYLVYYSVKFCLVAIHVAGVPIRPVIGSLVYGTNYYTTRVTNTQEGLTHAHSRASGHTFEALPTMPHAYFHTTVSFKYVEVTEVETRV